MFKQSARRLQLFCLWLALLPAPAPGQDAILTSEVTVDVSAEDAATAKARAIAEGETEGLKLLLEKLSPDEKEAIFASLDEKTIHEMVKDMETLEEKATGSHYHAILRISYDALAVSALTEKHVSAEGIPTHLDRSTAVLVVPLYDEGSDTLLWEPNNPWRNVWADVALEKSGGNLIVPYGDSVDGRTLASADAAASTFQQVAPLIARYGVSEVVVVRASYKSEPEVGVDIVRHHVNRERVENFTMEYKADLQENKEAFLTRVARDIAEQIDRQRQERLARKALGGQNVEAEVMIVAPLSTMDAWLRVRTDITTLPGVDKVELVALSPRQVDALVHFRGPKESLARALRGKGMRVDDSKNYWVVSRD